MAASDERGTAISDWLKFVKVDGDLPASAFKVAYELGQYTNRSIFQKDGSLVAWPALETIAAGIAMSERTARDMVKRLEVRGHLSIQVGHGPGNSSRYQFLTSNRQQPAGFDAEKTGSSLPDYAEENRKRPAGLIRQAASTKPAGYDTETGSRLPPNYCRTTEEQREGEAHPRATFLPDDFRLDNETHRFALHCLGSSEALAYSLRRFIDHHRQAVGSKAQSRDWQAKARLWIDEDAKRAGLNPNTSQQQTTSVPPSEAEWDGVLKLYAKTGHWTRHVVQFGGEPGTRSCKAPAALLAKHGLPKADAA